MDGKVSKMRQDYKENAKMLCRSQRLRKKRLINEKNGHHWKKVKGKTVRSPQKGEERKKALRKEGSNLEIRGKLV